MPESFVEFGNLIHQEMLAHPAIFTHQQAAHIAIITKEQSGIAREVLKHPSVQKLWQITPAKPEDTTDLRLQFFNGSVTEWSKQCAARSLDIIILPDKSTAEEENLYPVYFQLLRDDGILIQQGESFFAPADLKSSDDKLQKAGFYDTQVLHFPQPGFPSGWGIAIMAIKARTFKQVREKDIFNKPFATRYYNFDVHKAAMVMPEFMRTELTI